MSSSLARKTALVTVLVVVAATPALADEPPRAEPTAKPSAPWKLSIDSDPSTFALGGYSLWAMAKPARTHHLRVGVGAFAIDFPSFLVPYLNRSGETGWSLDVRAVMGFAGYFFGDRKGLYLGAYSGYLQSRHRRDDMPGVASRDNLTVLPTIGYQWFPFATATSALRGAYLQPWAGATFWIPVGGTTTLGTHTFKDPYVVPIAAVHLGYEF
jgi:hypothetical protein